MPDDIPPASLSPHPPDQESRRAGECFARLVAIMARLRGPDGCPWDREQTLASLAPYVLEEAAEVVDAIERGDLGNLCEEVGDLLFEGVFLAQLAHDDGAFDVADALDTVNAKLVRRHPHVFGTDAALTPAEVKTQWDAIKAQEKAARGDGGHDPGDVLAGVPVALPALLRARELCRKAATVGFDWPDAASILDKVDEEVAELRDAIAVRAGEATATPGDAAGDPVAEELGDLLFVLANLARRLDVDPEAALRAANRKFERRFAAMREQVEARGTTLEAASLDEMEAGWQAVKRAEAGE